MLSRISAAKSAMLTPRRRAEPGRDLRRRTHGRASIAEYQRLLRKANAIDFDDLLILPIRLFDAEPGLLERYQERFQHILVDEYQDTNRVQYVLVEALAIGTRISSWSAIRTSRSIAGGKPTSATFSTFKRTFPMPSGSSWK